MRVQLLAAALSLGVAGGACAQSEMPPFDYVPSEKSRDYSGKAPGLKSSELAPAGRTFHLVFSKGDDVAGGLYEFAEKNHLTDAYFTAIGAFGSAVIGWSDREKKAFKVIRINEEMEVSAFNGSITRDQNGKPAVHAHCVVSLLRTGAVYAGHCLREEVSLTLQLYVTDSKPNRPMAAEH